MTRFAEVSINLPRIDRSYDYAVPEALQGVLQPGMLVVVPFGKQVVQGVVLALIDQPEVAEVLPIQELVSAETLLTPQQLKLAEWMAEATFAPLGACVNLMIPIGLSKQADVMVSLAEDTEPPRGLGEVQTRLVNTLRKRGPLTGRQLERALPKLNWRAAVESLRKQGLLTSQPFLPPPSIAPKTIRTAALSIPPEAVAGLERSQLSTRTETAERRQAILDLLAREAFPIDFSWIYAQTQATYADLKALANAGLIHFNETEVWRDPLADMAVDLATPPRLTEDQDAAWRKIEAVLGKDSARPVLLHGVTGSGKTEIYMRAVAETLAKGQQALVLVPEIAMTPQTVRRFMARFPNQVGIYHSKLSDGERYDTWRRARQGDLGIIIGARSALFTPLPKLGLIVLDECDHDSYDESERVPFYHGVETAEAYAGICGASLILGSATPRVTQYYRAGLKEWQLIELPRRVLTHANPEDGKRPALLSLELPPVKVVDMRQELKEGNTSPLSRELHASLEQVLKREEQAILFLNRKGSATYVFCRNCGEALLCPREGFPLVYHNSRQGLLCHTCGYTRNMPTKCPQCGSNQIRQLGMGTERLEAMVQEAFPKARLLRWDAESTTGKDAHELILSHFSAHRADVLIGTQMLAKGLDLPLVTLVGIVLAETGLNLPDYRAYERTFQVLTQVAGRAGRSARGGRVILQTYQPDHPVIQATARHDYHKFYQEELERRRELRFPPYSRLVRLEYRHLNEGKAREAAMEMAGILREEIAGLGRTQTDFIGPLPAYYRRLWGYYRWQIILRGPQPLDLLKGLPLRNWLVEPDPPDLL